jgi:hypothetical protein
MMRLVALRDIQHGCGTIKAEHPFQADEHEALRLIDAGKAVAAADYEGLPWSGRGYWRVQPEWSGETAAIIAGGPSVTPEQAEAVRGLHVIAVNNAVQLAPEADILYFCDARWYEWHRQTVRDFKRRRVTLENLRLQDDIEVRCLRDYGVVGFAPRNDGVTNGRNGGFQALHLAAWLGAGRVLLLGFDMRAANGRLHWHEEHPVHMGANIFEGWVEAFGSLAPELARRGVEVINCAPGSALHVFPRMPLEAALAQPLAEELPDEERA